MTPLTTFSEPSIQSLNAKMAAREKFNADDVTPALSLDAVTWLREYHGDFEFLVDLRDRVLDGSNLSYRQVAGVLNCVLADLRRSAKKAAPSVDFDAVLVDGSIYRVDGTMFKIRRGRSGHFYAFELHVVACAHPGCEKPAVVTGVDRRSFCPDHEPFVAVPTEPTKHSWEYVGRRPLATLVATKPLTLDEMSEWGVWSGVCLSCGAPLTVKKSVERGIGPVCAKKYPHK